MIKSKIIFIFFILQSCSFYNNLSLKYQKHKMKEDITQNRRDLYNQSYGEVRDPDLDIEY